MYGILIMKILIKIAVATPVFMGAYLEFNTAFHVMDTRSLGHGLCHQLLFPGYYSTPVACNDLACSSQPIVFIGYTSHGLVKTTGWAMVVNRATFLAYHTCLHPDTRGMFFGRFIL
jgi:hypothetical protein